MKATKLLIVLFLFGILSSCKEPDPLSPLEFEQTERNALNKGKNTVSVLTRNIYVGADVDAILQVEDPNYIPWVVFEVFESLKKTNFPERAEALAKEIAENQPHLIGLQEVSLIRIQSPGDYIIGGSAPAEEVFMDYLDILVQALWNMGLQYDVVAKIENMDVEMPMEVSGSYEQSEFQFDDIRLTDYDVILAKRGVKISNVKTKNYSTKVVIEEMGIEMPRGYVAVTAKIKETKYRFVNTHLEDADAGGDLLLIQQAQAEELLSDLASVKIPLILVGDFNTAAPSEATYQLLTSTPQYKDAWLMNSLFDNPDGYTYGHDLDLLNNQQNFWKRIDYIFVRNGVSGYKGINLKGVEAEVVGDESLDKTSSGLWPSDHGGVIADLKFADCKKVKCKKTK